MQAELAPNNGAVSPYATNVARRSKQRFVKPPYPLTSRAVMESNDLQSASIYVNNLLLARGLLRDGKSVDFARLAQPTERRKRKHQQQLRFEDGVDPEKEKERDGDPYKTTSQVLNLVHELILKRDVRPTTRAHALRDDNGRS